MEKCNERELESKSLDMEFLRLSSGLMAGERRKLTTAGKWEKPTTVCELSFATEKNPEGTENRLQISDEDANVTARSGGLTQLTFPSEAVTSARKSGTTEEECKASFTTQENRGGRKVLY